MSSRPGDAGILLVDDGELDPVAALLDAQHQPYSRLRGGQIPAEVPPPRDLLIVTPRRVERVRRGSPPDAPAGRPLRIIAVEEDSPAMRRRLRRSGLHLLVRLPADAEIWRLLLARALYRGEERRLDPRVAVGSPVAIAGQALASPSQADSALLLDLSNRGCRLRTSQPLSVGDPVAFSLPAGDDGLGGDGEGLALRGRVRRIVVESDGSDRALAVTFDEDLSEAVRTRLTAMINRWASGPDSLAGAERPNAPAIPPCQLPTLPDLTLDDETDPPVRSHAEIRVALAVDARPPAGEDAQDPRDRRSSGRARFDSTVRVEGSEGPTVLIGRDLSPGGMRVERFGPVAVGDRFRIALHGPGRMEPFALEAEVIRDDGDEGFALSFRNVEARLHREIEKIVACLPDVESLEEGEVGGLGTILSEILRD